MTPSTVNIDHLILIRKSRNPFWRLLLIIPLLGLILAIWLAFHGYKEINFEIFESGPYTWKSRIFFGLLLGLSLVSLFRKDPLADWIFSLVQSFWIVLLSLWITRMFYLVLNPEPNRQLIDWLVCTVFLLVPSMFIYLIWKKSRDTWRSLVPVKKWQKYRLMRLWSRQASIQRKRKSTRRSGTKTYTRKSLLKFIFLGSLALFQTLSCWFLSVLFVFTKDVLPRKWPGIPVENWTALRIFERPDGEPGWDDFPGILLSLLMGWASLIWFGHLWNWFQRNAIRPSEIPLSASITDQDILYLRSFENEIRYVSGKRLTLPRLLLLGYPYNFSLEEMINHQLRFIGKSYAMGSLQDIPHGGKKLIPLGVERYYSDEWIDEVKTGLAKAKMIVLIMGNSKALMQEISWIKEGNFLDKTLFLFPHAETNFKGLREFWNSVRQFKAYEKSTWEAFETNVLGNAPSRNPLSLDFRQIIAVCFHNHTPLFFRSGQKDEIHFESALDVAGSFIGVSPELKACFFR